MGIDIGGIDEIEAFIDEGIQNAVRCRLVDGPTEHVAAKTKRNHFEAGSAKLPLLHGSIP